MLAGEWLALISVVVAFIAVVFVKKQQRGKRPPRPIQLPWFGTVGINTRLLHREMQAMANKLGPIFSFNTGSVDVVVLSDAKLINEAMLSSKSAFFNGRLNGRVQRAYCGLLNDPTRELGGIGVSMGPIWRQNRKLAFHYMLSKPKLDSLDSVISEEVDKLIDVAYQAVAAGMQQIDIALGISKVSLNIMGKLTVGDWLQPLDSPEALKFENKANPENFAYADIGAIESYFPFATKLEGKDSRFHEYRNSVDMLRDLLQNYVDNFRNMKPEERPPSFLKDLLELAQEEIDVEDLDDVGIVTVLLDLILAGSDSMSKSLAYGFMLLINNPSVQDKLRYELGSSPFPMNELCDKQYLDAVVYEMLRLFPAAPLALPHTCVEDHSIGEYTITKGTVVVANIFALHRDPLLWTDPELFRPERFLEDDTLRKSANFIPFGVGPRVCIGKQLGIVGMKKVIAGLLQNFVVYAPGTSCVIRIKEEMGLTLSASPYAVSLRPAHAAEPSTGEN